MLAKATTVFYALMFLYFALPIASSSPTRHDTAIALVKYQHSANKPQMPQVMAVTTMPGAAVRHAIFDNNDIKSHAIEQNTELRRMDSGDEIKALRNQVRRPSRKVLMT